MHGSDGDISAPLTHNSGLLLQRCKALFSHVLPSQEQRQRAALMKRERDSAAEQALRRQVARNDRIVASFAIFTTSAVLLLPCAMVSIHGVDTDPRPGEFRGTYLSANVAAVSDAAALCHGGHTRR